MVSYQEQNIRVTAACYFTRMSFLLMVLDPLYNIYETRFRDNTGCFCYSEVWERYVVNMVLIIEIAITNKPIIVLIVNCTKTSSQ